MIADNTLFGLWVGTVKSMPDGMKMNLLNHPNVFTGNSSIIPGAISREIALRRIHEWTTPCEQSDADFEVPVWLLNIEVSGYFVSPPVVTEDCRFRKIVDPRFRTMVSDCSDADIIKGV